MVKKIVFYIFLVLVLARSNIYAAYGRLVAVSDDWVFSSYSDDASQFAVSSMNWLTQNSESKSILFDQDYYEYAGYQFSNGEVIGALHDAGYTVTISDSTSWDLANLINYNAVVWGSAFEGLGQKMLDYSNAGGNILFVGGTGGPITKITEKNILLNPFGITDSGILINGKIQITSFNAHQCVNNVTQLYSENPSNLQFIPDFNGEVVSAQDGVNYIIAAPEPATLLLLGLGAVMVRKK